MGSTTLPRGGPLLRTYSPAIGGPIPADRLKSLPAGRLTNYFFVKYKCDMFNPIISTINQYNNYLIFMFE